MVDLSVTEKIIKIIGTSYKYDERPHIIDNVLKEVRLFDFPVYSIMKIFNGIIDRLDKKDNEITNEGWLESDFEINSRIKIEDFMFLSAFKGKFTRFEREQLYNSCLKSGISPNEIEQILLKIRNFKESIASDINAIIIKNQCARVDPVFETFTDSRDGKVYNIIKIGTQVWMAENLAWLPSVNPSKEGSAKDPHYYVYRYESDNVSEAKETSYFKTYGALYNWPAAKIACPKGWHLPYSFEWEKLIAFLGSHETAGGKMKALKEWSDVNIGASNESGFSALPGGHRGSLGSFHNLNVISNFWSANDPESDETYYYFIKYYIASISKGLIDKNFGFSVRCIRN